MCSGVHDDPLCASQSYVSCQVCEPGRIMGQRLLPPQHKISTELVGLAIVAAIQVEMDTATSSERGFQQVPHHSANEPRPPATQHFIPVSANQKLPHHVTPPANQEVPHHGSRLREKSKSPSIFTLSNPSWVDTSSTHLSTSCFLCKRPLPSDKDIYMYRGNQAFCTKQCRHHQMVTDESKEKLRLCAASIRATKCHINSCTIGPNFYKEGERVFGYG